MVILDVCRVVTRSHTLTHNYSHQINTIMLVIQTFAQQLVELF